MDTNEIQGVDSDLSEMSDVPDEEIFSPGTGIQQSSQANYDNVAMETIIY